MRTAFLLTAMAFCLAAARAEEPARDQAWQAEWIGMPAEEAPALSCASWIWADEPGGDPVRKAKPGRWFFSRRFTIAGTSPVSSARAVFAADNRFKLTVNGRVAGGGDDWQRPGSFEIAGLLRPGENRIVVEAGNDPDAGPVNAAGLIGRIVIGLKEVGPLEVVTDGQWTFAPAADAADGKPVKVIGEWGVEPWGKLSARSARQPEDLWTCFRKEFSLPGIPRSAVARIAVDSKYWLWVNGRLAVYEGGLKRGPNPKDTYFDVVDLAPYLVQGRNTIAALTWYWGKDGFSHKSSGKPGFVAEFEIDGRISGTDASWKAVRHPSYGRTGEPHPNYRLSDANIHFDARQDPGSWTSPAFDDSAWPPAVALGKPPAAPWNRLVERPIPLWRVGALLPYENAAALPRISDGKPVVANLPRNLTISPYLKIKAPAGLKIDIRTDNYKGGGEFNFRSEYVTREGVQEFESLAYLNGHSVIYTIPPGVEILDLRYRETRYDTDFSGEFECDDPFLNRLWMKARHTMNVNMRDGIQDPDRERAQWWGDVAILLGEMFYSCDMRAHALIRKAILNLVDWQKPDGVLYSPVPAGSWDKELPGQMLSSIGEHGFWYYYRYTGDRDTIAHAYPAVKRYLSLWKLGPDGLVAHRPGGWDWGDWGKNIDRPVMDNALLYQALGAAIEMARLTGNEADVDGYEKMRASIAANYNRLLWTGTEYRSPGYKGKTDDRGHGLAALYGLATPDQLPAIKKVFTTSFEASPYMEKYILESLLRSGDTDAALARMKSRYKKMVESDLSTLWEGWGIGAEGYGGGTYNHGWSGGPLTLLMEYVAGISPTSPGFATYQVRPQAGPLRNIKAGFDTVRGRIEVVIARDGESFRLKLGSPEGTTATVCIPLAEYGFQAVAAGGSPIWRNGKPAGKVPGIEPLGEKDGRALFKVAPGKWEFVAGRD